MYQNIMKGKGMGSKQGKGEGKSGKVKGKR